MKGAIIGDIVGSIYEFDNIRTKDFKFWGKRAHFTDDTVCTVAVAKAFRKYEEHPSCGNVNDIPITGEKLEDFLTMYLHNLGNKYHTSYGSRFKEWLQNTEPKPYNSWGNGAPMRCSPAGMLADSARHAFELGMITAQPTHNHVDGMIAAGVTAELIWLARNGSTKDEMRKVADEYYFIPELDDVRDIYYFKVDAVGTMDVALAAFFESTDFEDAIRNAISVGGDSDTIAAITGSIAEAYYGVPEEMWLEVTKRYLDPDLSKEVEKFYWHLEHRDEVRVKNLEETYYADFFDD